MKNFAFALLTATFTVSASAQKAGVKVSDIPTNEDTSIIIRKGDKNDALRPPDFEFLDGREEIGGDSENTRAGALNSWKAACNEWKQTLREFNPGGIVTMNCGLAKVVKDDYLFSASSMGTYKLRVRIRDARK